MNDWNDNPNQDPWAEPQQQQPSHDPYRAPQQPYQAGDSYNSGLPQSTNGTLVLILGVVSWLMCGMFTAIPGWLIARGDRQKIQAGMMQPDSSLEAGYWINFVLVIMTAVILALVMVLFVVSFVVTLIGAA